MQHIDSIRQIRKETVPPAGKRRIPVSYILEKIIKGFIFLQQGFKGKQGLHEPLSATVAPGAIRPHLYVLDRRVMTMLSGQDYAFGDNGGSQMSAQREVKAIQKFR